MYSNVLDMRIYAKDLQQSLYVQFSFGITAHQPNLKLTRLWESEGSKFENDINMIHRSKEVAAVKQG